jgi:hypothetical protein
VNFTARLAELRAEALSAAEPHRQAILQALALIDSEMAALRAAGFSAEISWPYGRGDVAKATSAKLSIGVEVKL